MKRDFVRGFAAAFVAMVVVSPMMAPAATITQWNFNSVVPDAATGTGTTLPSTGVGTASLVGGTTATFASGDASGGSSDPATGDDSGWNLTAFPASGAAEKTAGSQYLVSTLGFENISLSYDLRHSNTASRYETVQYTVDGINFVDAMTFDGNAGDTWFNGRMVDLSAIPAVQNNPLFGVRIVSSFAPGTAVYAASNGTSTYSGAGTWRFDMVTVSGDLIIPEPASASLVGLSLLGLALCRHRRK